MGKLIDYAIKVPLAQYLKEFRAMNGTFFPCFFLYQASFLTRKIFINTLASVTLKGGLREGTGHE